MLRPRAFSARHGVGEPSSTGTNRSQRKRWRVHSRQKTIFKLGTSIVPNTQAGVGALDADPLFTAIADFCKEIFHALLADLQAPSGDA